MHDEHLCGNRMRKVISHMIDWMVYGTGTYGIYSMLSQKYHCKDCIYVVIVWGVRESLPVWINSSQWLTIKRGIYIYILLQASISGRCHCDGFQCESNMGSEAENLCNCSDLGKSVCSVDLFCHLSMAVGWKNRPSCNLGVRTCPLLAAGCWLMVAVSCAASEPKKWVLDARHLL